ncbi:hypothetical protein E1264_09200 [Actinomadura sp. KC216]|uniref:hypothetical protein n=1 Tax=Actinomadura sp. KC216 TaxID=2530370 RepID=UPI001045FF2E|nr:hypothetical protein [Actinomadura sp. KC216]TDB89137.1 hypothetical protein E1264_09200 [Actinomadura sp. KC216]
MTTIEVSIDVHRLDDVTFTVDTGEFLEAIGPVDRKVEDALNEALDAFVDEHAYYQSERWYSLLHERDSQKVLHHALATALGIDTDEVSTDYSFCTCNFENHLSEDFGGTVWDITDGRRFLTIESGARGFMNASVEVRAITCEEPSYVIAVNSTEVQIGCTACEFTLDTGHERVIWTDLTREDEDGWARDGLFCPRCQAPLTAEVGT